MKIVLKGRGPIVGIDMFSDGDCLEYFLIIEGVELYANDEDITKKKGKYIKSDFIHQGIAKYSLKADDIIASKHFDLEFEFDLPDEDFNPKEIHLLKSDYEFEEIPYGILGDVIIYKDKPYYTTTPNDYSHTSYTNITLVEYGMSDFKLYE